MHGESSSQSLNGAVHVVQKKTRTNAMQSAAFVLKGCMKALGSLPFWFIAGAVLCLHPDYGNRAKKNQGGIPGSGEKKKELTKHQSLQTAFITELSNKSYSVLYQSLCNGPSKNA